MSSPEPKRLQRPSEALPTTADIYSARHGIDEETTRRLQNVGRRSRQAVSMGRPLMPSQSLPIAFQPGTNSHAFLTSQQTYEHARSIIVKEQHRAHELQPFGSMSPSALEEAAGGSSSNVDALSLSPRARAAVNQRLRFGPDGEVRLERTRGHKRTGDADDSDTDVDDPDTPTPGTGLGFEPGPALPGQSGREPTTPLPNVSFDFPPVFTSPALTHPELFSGPGAGAMGPPPLPAFGGRDVRGLPRRGLAKTMSAPVTRMGAWGMDVDVPAATAQGVPAPAAEEVEDGFDVAEWANNETF